MSSGLNGEIDCSGDVLDLMIILCLFNRSYVIKKIIVSQRLKGLILCDSHISEN